MINKDDNTYSGKDILVLDDIDAIRKNPGMFIGDTEFPNHLFYEVVNNAIDEHIMGFGNKIKITFLNHDTVCIQDFARGIPVDSYNAKYLACEIIFIKNHSGGKFVDNVYKRSGGLHGVGLVAVNALSSKLEVCISRDGIIHHMVFEYGRLITSITTENTTHMPNGTKITFTPDSTIFNSTKFDYEEILARLSHIAALNTNLIIEMYVEAIGMTNFDIHKPNGILELMDDFVKVPVLRTHIDFNFSDTEYTYQIIMNWSSNTALEKYIAFTNCIIQPDGGTHVQGVRSGILDFFIKNKIFNNILGSQSLQLSDIKTGLYFIINLSMQSPSFASQEKTRLVTSKVKIHILKYLSQFLTSLYESTPSIFEPIIRKINRTLLQKYHKQEELQLSAALLNGSLLDCYTKNRDEAELFIAEGESAAGIVKPVMDRRVQAILAMRGKIRNVEKSNLNQILMSSVIVSIFKAIGGTINSENVLVIDKLRYKRIIILADADVDGDHIRALILTMFHKYAPKIITEKKLYVAVPPLYKVQLSNHNSRYFNTEDDLIDFFYDHLCITYPKIQDKTINKQSIIFWLKFIYYKRTEINICSHTAVILDFIINNSITTFDIFVSKIDIAKKTLLTLSYTIEVFFTKQNELIIEDYSNLNKSTFTKRNIETMIDINIKNVQADYQYFAPIFDYKPILTLYNYIAKLQHKLVIQRFKGLGEMNKEQIYETVINKQNRILKLINIHDIEEANYIRNLLMGNLIQPRKIFITNHFKY